MPKNIRQTQGQNVYDPSNIEALEFNPAAGSKKVSEVGRGLLPIPTISGGSVVYVTAVNAAAVRLPSAGRCLAVYNNSGTVGAVTLGTDTNVPTALAAGATNSNGQVGIPCQPNAWTYIACNGNTQVISTAATLLVFMIDDETNIKQEAAY